MTRATGIIEYALLLALIAIGVLLCASAFGNAVAAWYGALLERLPLP